MIIEISDKKGFTLVELSIVLVVIGLLIGGILIGKNLIESSKLNRFVNDLRQYEIAIIQFHKKFKRYPGDSTYFIPPGNGDNILANGANGVSSCATAPNASLSNIEQFQFWAHLSQSKMLSKNYVSYSPQGTCASGVHDPDVESASTGKLIAPYIVYDAIAANELGYPGVPIYVDKQTSARNLYLELWPNPTMVYALENKLSAAPLTSFETQVGLANWVGLGKCTSTSYTTVACTDSNAMLGHFSYFIPPQ